MKTYVVNGTIVRSPKKIYKVDGVLVHKLGDFYESISPKLLFKISMAEQKGEERWTTQTMR